MTHREDCKIAVDIVVTKIKNHIHDECKVHYGMYRLTNEKISPYGNGLLIANPESIKSFIVSLFSKMQGKGFGLAAGDNTIKIFEEMLEVSLNIINREKAEIKIKGLLPLDIVGFRPRLGWLEVCIYPHKEDEDE